MKRVIMAIETLADDVEIPDTITGSCRYTVRRSPTAMTVMFPHESGQWVKQLFQIQ